MTTETSNPADGRPTLQDIADMAGVAVDRADEHIADANAIASRQLRRTNARLRRRSDRSLGLMGAFSAGLALGLFMSGSNRLVVLAGLLPAALAASVALERMDRETERARRRSLRGDASRS